MYAVPEPTLIEFCVISLFTLFVMFPLVGLVHELAHAVWGLLLTRGPVELRLATAVGAGHGLRRGRFTIGFDGRRSSTSFDRSALGRRSQLGCAASGPLATLVFAGAMTWVALEHSNGPALAFWLPIPLALWGGYSAVIDLRPRRENAVASDGWVIRDVLRGHSGRPGDALRRENAVANSVLAPTLDGDASDTRGSDQRS